MPYEKPLTVAEMIKAISHNGYLLPAIQREFVWPQEKITSFFDSLLRGYPTGTFLFWAIPEDKSRDFRFYEFLKNYDEKNPGPSQEYRMPACEPVRAVLDGQQRLTSLYIGLCGSYVAQTYRKWSKGEDAYQERKLYLNILRPKDDGLVHYDFRFLSDKEKARRADDGQRWFAAGDVLAVDFGKTVSSYVKGIRDKGQAAFARQTLRRFR